MHKIISGSLFAVTALLLCAVPATANVEHGQIEGDYNGWDGHTVYELMNGEVWKQTDYHYHYHFAFSPKVLIYKDKYGYRMHVDGDDDDDDPYVRRVDDPATTSSENQGDR